MDCRKYSDMVWAIWRHHWKNCSVWAKWIEKEKVWVSRSRYYREFLKNIMMIHQMKTTISKMRPNQTILMVIYRNSFLKLLFSRFTRRNATHLSVLCHPLESAKVTSSFIFMIPQRTFISLVTECHCFMKTTNYNCLQLLLPGWLWTISICWQAQQRKWSKIASSVFIQTFRLKIWIFIKIISKWAWNHSNLNCSKLAR